MPPLSKCLDPSLIITIHQLQQVEDVSDDASTPLVRPAGVSFETDDAGQSGQLLLVSLAYWKPSEKLTVVIMKGRNFKPIEKSRKPGRDHQ